VTVFVIVGTAVIIAGVEVVAVVVAAVIPVMSPTAILTIPAASIAKYANFLPSLLNDGYRCLVSALMNSLLFFPS